MSATFLLTTLVIVATPGTGALYTLSAGLSRGTRASVVAAFGCTLGTLPHLVAVMTVRDEKALRADDTAPRSARRVIANGVLVNLLNPKLTLFFFAFLPQFVPAGGSATPRMLALGGVFMVVTFAVFALYGVLAAAVRDRVLARPRVTLWLRRCFGAAFAGLAGKLALADR